MSSSEEVIGKVDSDSDSDSGSESEPESCSESVSIFEEATHEYKKIIVGLSSSVKMLKGMIKTEANDLIMPNGLTLGAIIRGAIGPNFGFNMIKSLKSE
jgi:hypothetical protein